MEDISSKQLTLEDAARVKGPDRWDANTYIHYGVRYGVQVVPTTIKGEYRVKHVRVMDDEEIKNNLA